MAGALFQSTAPDADSAWEVLTPHPHHPGPYTFNRDIFAQIPWIDWHPWLPSSTPYASQQCAGSHVYCEP